MHKDLQIDPRRLASWVRAAALKQQFMEEGIKVPNLTLSHFVNLLQIEDEEQRTQLAREANRDHLSARQILNKGQGVDR